MGFLIYLLARVLAMIALPVGAAYDFVQCFYKHSLGTALKNLNRKFYLRGKATDIYGNTTCPALWNRLFLTKDSVDLFGKEGETMSQVLAKNLPKNTLSERGKKLSRLLIKFKDTAFKNNNMKTVILFFLFSCAVAAAQAQQKDINIQVQEINAADTAFNFHPTKMLIRVEGLNVSYDSCLLYFETNLSPDVDTSLYMMKEAFIRGRVKMPLAAFKAGFKSDGSIDSTVANQILAPFKLKYIPSTTQP